MTKEELEEWKLDKKTEVYKQLHNGDISMQTYQMYLEAIDKIQAN